MKGSPLVIPLCGNAVVSPTNFRAFSNKPKSSESTCSVEFKVTSAWNGGCTGELVITNTSDTTITDWLLSFTCNGQVNSVWNGKLRSKTGTTYTVCNDGSYPKITPGATIRIGINLNATGTLDYPKDFMLH